MSARAVVLALLVSVLPIGGPAHAGGPLVMRGNGLPYVWSTISAIPYRTDNGPLSATVNEAAARARVTANFGVWQAVATASISYTRVGFINAVGAFAGGDVDTAAEYAAVEQDCYDGNQSPVIFDANGSILTDLGLDETSVIGFAGPCSLSGGLITSGQVVMNGLFQDGAAAPVRDISVQEFDTAIVHEIGHFSGLDHSQVNVNCLSACSADDIAGLPTMFPFLISVEQGRLAIDDIAWLSRLYPRTTGGTTFAGTHGTITGTVFFSDGESPAQLVNVMARQADTGANQDRTHAVAVISGYRFKAFHGNPLTGAQASPFGSSTPGDIGLFEIPVPAGTYTIEVESINAEFTDGSSIGPFWIRMPGTAPARSVAIAVGAGTTVSGINVTLVGTPPRFDQFEGP